MATIKSYTDIEQSKKLAKILPIESADMRFCFSHTLDGRTTGHYPMIGREPSLGTIPCWSLAALLSVIPNPIIGTHFVTHKWEGESNKVVNHQDGLMEIEQLVSTEGFDNPVDACYKMILKLNKLNLL